MLFYQVEEELDQEMNVEISDMKFCQDFVKLHNSDTGEKAQFSRRVRR